MNRARRVGMLLCIFLAIVASGDTHLYGDDHTQNAGVYWNLGHHWCGIEYRGHPGFFCDVT